MTNQRTARVQGTVRRKIATAAMAIGVVLFGIAVAPGVASAHHPMVSGKTQCRTSETWSVTWTAQADQVRGFTWQITSPSGYAPAGSQADSLTFTRTATYTAASATENVSASWSNGATGSGSATVYRPEMCPVQTTTTTITPTTTTQPEVTTTQPEVTTTQPEVSTTQPGATTTQPAATTTVTAPVTTVVGQEGPTSTVDQSSGAATTTDPLGRTLPATGNDGSGNLIVIALTLIGFGAVMLRFASKPNR